MGVAVSLPYTLTNGTLEDATQVQAMFQAIVSALASSAAGSGPNSDITALNGLTTPLAPPLGGTPVYTGGTSGGSANAQTITVSPSSFALNVGATVVFVAGASNTGAATLSVNATGAVALRRKTELGLLPLAGSEIIAGFIVTAIYDGAYWQLDGIRVSPATLRWFAGGSGGSAPSIPGWLPCDGTLLSRTAYPSLFAQIGTTYGAGDGSTTFALPNARGRTLLMVDTAGATTPSYTTLGASGGEAAHVLTYNEMPVHSHSASSVISDPQHSHVVNDYSGFFSAQGGGTTSFAWNGRTSPYSAGAYTGITVSTSVSNAGGGVSHNNMQPSLAQWLYIKL